LANLLKKSGNIVYEAELGLSSIGWRILARLGAEGPMTHTELVELALFDKGQLSKAVGRLVGDGLIARKKRDWRTHELSLTAEGERLYGALDDISRARHRTLTQGIGREELAQFLKTLDKITHNAKRLLAP
jgi:DNA-binding MarR family transcriptional regulator